MSQHLNSMEKSLKLTDLRVSKIYLMKQSADFQKINNPQKYIRLNLKEPIVIRKAKPIEDKSKKSIVSSIIMREILSLLIFFHPTLPSCLLNNQKQTNFQHQQPILHNYLQVPL